MTTKKATVAAFSFVFLFLFLCPFPQVLAEWNTGQTPDMVVGQPDLSALNEVNVDGARAFSFNYPRGVFVKNGRLFVTDTNNHRVLIWNSTTAIVANNSPADIVLGHSTFTAVTYNDGGTVNGARLYSPIGVFADNTRLFVADYNNNRVLIWNSIPTNQTEANTGASIAVGQTSLILNGCCTVSQSRTYGPADVFSDGTRLFVSDTRNHRILIYNSIPTNQTEANAGASSVLGQPLFTTSQANYPDGLTVSSQTLNAPNGVFSDGTRLFVADVSNNRVLIWNTIPASSAENFKGADIVIGQPNMTSNTPDNPLVPDSRAQLQSPTHVWSDGARLFIADSENRRVLIWNTIPTNQAQANTGANVIISNFSYNSPERAWTDGGKLYIPDRDSNRVFIFNSIPVFDTTASAANLVLGQPSASYVQVKAWSGTDKNLYYPGVGTSDGTRFMVADRYNHRVLIWNSVPSSNYAAANVVLGQNNFNDNFMNYTAPTPPTISASSLYYPNAIHSDGARLFVADTNNNRVLIWDPIPNNPGQAANYVMGHMLMSQGNNNDGGRSRSSLYTPYGVYSDGTRLFVADGDNHRVLIWNTIPTFNKAPAQVIIGQTAENAGNPNAGVGSVNSAGLNVPYSVNSDGTRLFVADYYNNRILIWNTIPTTWGDDADVVAGQPDMGSSVSSSALNRLYTPTGVYSDGRRLFVADYNNGRVLIWNQLPTANNSTADVNLNVYAARSVAASGKYLYVSSMYNNRVVRFTNTATAYLNATITPITQPTLAQNQNLAFLKLELASTNISESIEWLGLKVWKEGNIANTSIKTVQVWRDGGQLGIFEPYLEGGGDTLIGGQTNPFTNGAALVTTTEVITSSTQTYWVALTLNNLPHLGTSMPQVGLKIRQDMGSFTINNPGTPAPNDGDMLIGGLYKTSIAQTQDVPDAVTVTSNDNLKPANILFNTTGNVMAAFSVVTSSDFAYLDTANSITMNKLGSVPDSVSIGMKAWLDVNGNNQFEPGGPDTQISIGAGGSSFTGGKAILNINYLSANLEISTTSKRIFIVADVPNDVSANSKTFGLNVDTSSFQLDGIDVVSTVNMPYSTSISTIVAARPNVTADRSTGTWYSTSGYNFTGNFGSDNVSYFRYVWDQIPAHTFTGIETQWLNGALSTGAAASGSWYLHVKAYDSLDRPGGTQDMGPFNYDGTMPAFSGGSFQSQKMDLSWALESGIIDDMTPNVRVQVQDTHSGLRVNIASMSYSTNGGSGWSAWQSVPVGGSDGTTALQWIPANNIPFNQASLTQNKVRFRAQDMLGNTVTSPFYNVQIQVAPDPVNDLLAVPGTNTGEIRLTWTSPQDNDAGTGAVQSYTVKITTYTFGDGTFDSEKDIQTYSPLPVPLSPGIQQIMTVTGLIPNEKYYFHLKSKNSGNYVSPLDTVIPQANSRAKAPTIIVTSTNIAPAETPQGTEAALVKLRLYADISSVDWTGITLTHSGNGMHSDVEEIRIYRDNASLGNVGSYDYNTTQPGMSSDIDVMVSPPGVNYTSSTSTFNLAATQPISQSTYTYFVVYKVNTTAMIGKTQGVYLQNGSMSVNFPGAVSDTNFPINSNTTLVTDGPSNLFIQSSATVPSIAVTGSPNVPYLKLTMWTDQGTVNLTGLTLNRLGIGNDGDVTVVSVFRDDDGTPGLNPVTDTPLTNGLDAFSGNACTIAFKDKNNFWALLTETITTTPKSYFIALSMTSAESSIGNTIGLSLATTSSFLIQGSADKIDPSVTFPITTGLAPIARPPNNMFVTFTNLAPATISQDSMIAMGKLQLFTDSGQAKLTGLAVNRLGTDGNVVSEIRMYKDVINPGNFDFNDLIIATSAFSQSGTATLNISPGYSPQNITTSTSTYYVVYKISPTATPNQSCTAKITNAASFILSNINTTAIGTFPMQSTSTVVTLTIDTLTVTPVTPAPPLEVTQGDKNVVMRKLRFNTDANQVTWAQITFTKQGTAQGNSIERIAIYKDTVMDSGALNLNDSDPNRDQLVAEIAGTNIFPGASLTSNLAMIEPQYIIPAPQEYFVVVDFAQTAVPFTTFGLSLADINAIGITSPDVVFNNFPINPPFDITIKEYIDTVYVNWTDLTPADANFGTTSLPMLKLSLFTGFADAKLDWLRFDRTGTLPQAISGIKIYKDAQVTGQPGYGSLETEIDFMISTTSVSPTANMITIPMPLQLITATTRHYFVAVDISNAINSSDVGKSFGLRMIDKYYVESATTAPNSVSNSGFPIGTANVPLREPDSIVTVTGQDIAPVTASQGDTDVALLKLTMITDQFSAKFSKLKVTRKGAGSQDSDLTQVRLYRDDGDGIFERNGADQIVSLTNIATFVNGNADLVFTSTETITASPATYFLTAGISQIATPGAKAGLMIADPFAVTIIPNDQVRTTGFPVSSGDMTIQATVDNMVVTPYVMPVTTNLLQNTANVPFIKVSLKMQQNKGMWQSLSLEKTGTLPDGNITNVTIWKDSTGNGTLETSSDTALSSSFGGFINGQGTVSLTQNEIQDDTTSRIYFVAVSFSPTAEVNGTFALRLSNVNSFKLVSPDYTSSAGINYPWDSLQGIVLDKPDSLAIGTVNMVGTSGMYQNRSAAMAKLTFGANEDKVLFEAMSFIKLGTIPDEDFAGVALWRDDGDGLWDGVNDIWFSSGSMVNGNADFVFSPNLTITPQQQTMFLVSSLKRNATAEATFGFKLTQANVKVKSPDSVSNVNLPFETSLTFVRDGRTPTQPVVKREKRFVSAKNKLKFDWNSEVYVGRLQEAEYAIGTSSGATDVVGWTSVGVSTDVKLINLTMENGKTYYVSVRTKSDSNFTSDVGVSMPVTVDVTPPTVPDKPQLIKDEGQVLLTWPAAAVGASGLVGYQVEERRAEKPVWRMVSGYGTTATAPDESGNYNTAPDKSGNYNAPPSVTSVQPIVSLDPNLSGTYFYRVKAINGADVVGEPSPALRAVFGVLSSSEVISDVTAYPNPFDSREENVTINYVLNQDTDVTITIYDLFGYKVKELKCAGGATGGMAGANDVFWDGANEKGDKVSHGAYLAYIEGADAKKVAKIAVIH